MILTLVHVFSAISFVFLAGQNISIQPNLKSLEFLREKMISEYQDFIEINLEEMIVRVYKGGEIKQNFNIFRKGNPDNWGGSLSGLYFAGTKNKIAYSSIARAYMPWSIKIFGKYYIHGEPYYASGKKIETIHSGGCIQLLDKDARALFDLTLENTPILIIDKKNDSYDYQKPRTSFPEINASAYLVADIESGHVFSSKNANIQYPIASLTKMMTAVAVTESVDLRRSIQITEEMLKTYVSAERLEVGKNFGVVELLYPLLVSSGNDAAEAIAGFLGKKKTIEIMNEKARSIAMGKTEFADVSGINQENKSTAKDLFYLTRYIFNNRFSLFKITKGEKVDFSRGAEKKWLNNKNLFFENKNFIGGKTGYIKASGHTGIFLFRFLNKKDEKERNIAIIILGAKNLYNPEDGLKSMVQKTVEWLKENYFD